MLQKQVNFQGKGKNIAISCKQKLQEDVVSENSYQRMKLDSKKEIARGARSYMSRSDEENWDQLSEHEKKEAKEEINKNLGKKVKNQMMNKGKMFTDEIIVSESVSIQEDFSMGDNNRDDRLNYQQKREEVEFNIMLIGAIGTGKTTFMECFLKQYKQKNNHEPIKKETDNIYYEKVLPNYGDPTLNMTVFDTPGYEVNKLAEYIQMIKEQIYDRMYKYKEERMQIFTESAVYTAGKKRLIDPRIHCVLFFLRGPRIFEEDWKLLSELQKYVSIIPIIAKGDMYTQSQIKQLKKMIKERVTKHQIKWFDAEEYLRQNEPQQLKSLISGTFGKSPPFVIASSTSQIEEGRVLKVGRQFPWGTCFIEDPEHTDFLLLSRMLIRFFKTPLIKLTEIKTENTLAKIEKEQNRKGLKKYFGFGIGVIVLSALVYKFNKDILPSK